MCDDLSLINNTQKNFKTFQKKKKNVSMPRKNEKKLHTQEFQLKCIGGNMRCSFQIYLKFIKLVIPKIPFILVLYSFNFYFKITCPPSPPPQAGGMEGGRVLILLLMIKFYSCYLINKYNSIYSTERLIRKII